MGPTLPEIAALLPDLKPISKRSFSCLAHPPFEQALRATGRRQFVLLGIEAHVCVYQTAVDLILQGYQAEVIADAVASRSPHNRELGLARARQGGAGISSVEMALFELLKAAEGPAFKEILAIVK
jgi:nicotinamidase-related amidase